MTNGRTKKFIDIIAMLAVAYGACADAAPRKASRKRVAERSSETIVAASDTALLETPQQAEAAPETAKPSSESSAPTITKYNCAEHYNKCMDRLCFDNRAKSRCKCHNDSGIFDQATEACAYVADACPSVSADVTRAYKRGTASDCTIAALDENGKDIGKTIYNRLADLIICLKPKCKIRGSTDEFVKCFDEDNLEIAMDQCKDSYKGEEDVPMLKDMLYRSVAGYKSWYCDEIFGEMRDDGNCHLRIGIGLSPLNIQRSMEFKVGDKVVCSQKSFGVHLEGSQIAKKRAKKNLIIGAVRFGVQAIGLAGSIVSAAGAKKSAEAGKKTAESISNDPSQIADKITFKVVDEADKVIIKNVADNMGNQLEAASGSIAGAAMATGTKMIGTAGALVPDFMVVKMGLGDVSMEGQGKCFAMRDKQTKQLFPEDDESYYELRWAPNWAMMPEIDYGD
ncbi:MAG: hypothetical protein LBI17_03815 [Rickettsiales bacterium]|jgi:hypothetical protein|nr:hypothetical protein [Rickettsiales bacterium]